MKTTGMAHQLTALRRMNGRKGFGLFMEQGTGKSWTMLADGERLYSAGLIDGMLVFAPKGVHTNWILREIPTHMSEPVIARAWASGMGMAQRRKVMELFKQRDEDEQPPLRILAMNYDAINTNDGFAFAKQFLLSTKAMIVADESSRIKNPKSERTKALMKLRDLAVYRRIGTGTPIPNAPTDVFAQMEFLEDGLCGTSNYRAFVAEYAKVIPPDHPMMRKMIQKNPRMAWAQIVEKDPETGRPIWRNIDKLQRILEPHTYRILKKDCLKDLPEKIPPKNIYFEMTPSQRKAYKLMDSKFRIEMEDGSIKTVSKLNSINKLQQITSGFVLVDGKAIYVEDKNPRLKALLEFNEYQDAPYIVWAQFREELRAIAAALREAGRRVVEYHGGITDQRQRDKNVDDFQSGKADTFVGQPQSGGIGLTLTAAEAVVFYSNGYNLETRLHAEDRPHRIGLRHPVAYYDIVAAGTVDEPIAWALQSKKDVAHAILDPAFQRHLLRLSLAA